MRLLHNKRACYYSSTAVFFDITDSSAIAKKLAQAFCVSIQLQLSVHVNVKKNTPNIIKK